MKRAPMALDLPLTRRILTAVENKPQSLRAVEGERREVKKLRRSLQKAKLIEVRSGWFGAILQLTGTGENLLKLMRNDNLYVRVRQEIETLDISDLNEVSRRFFDSISGTNLPEARKSKPRLFLAHGHDMNAREIVTVFLERIGFDVIILDEQHNAGKTVIEKFEANADVNYAVVLLTGDDLGGKSDSELKKRARQNVIFELGFFIGRLTRERVCALRVGEIELPSDIAGMVWLTFDGRWKRELATELEKAGYPIEWRKLVE